MINLLLCLSVGALHQSECEKERLSEHAESGRPAQRVLHHLLRHTHTLSHTHTHTEPPPPPFRWTYTLHFCACGHVHMLSHIMYNTNTKPVQSSIILLVVRLDLSVPPVNGTTEASPTDTLTGRAQLTERPENSPDELLSRLFRFLCDNPTLQQFLACKLQYWPDCYLTNESLDFR